MYTLFRIRRLRSMKFPVGLFYIKYSLSEYITGIRGPRSWVEKKPESALIYWGISSTFFGHW